MRKIMIFVLLILLIYSYGCTNKADKKMIHVPNKNTPVKYIFNPEKSITYKKPYDELKNELLYARIVEFSNKEGSSERHTIQIIRDKDKLVDIVREFDKLKASNENYKINTTDPVNSIKVYGITIWRKGSSVSYSLIKYNGDFYYSFPPYVSVYHKLSQNLINMLGIK